MEIFVCKHTALSIWRAFGDSISRPRSARASLPLGTAAKALQIKGKIPSECWHEGEIDVLVPDAADRRRSKGVRCHVWSSTLPPRSFAKFDEGVQLSSPEFLFLQMASGLSLIKLIELGFELCGSYSLSKGSKRGFISRGSLASKKSITDYLDRCSNVKGLKRARRAARYLIDGSASPMETVLAMVLCLPMNLGGLGFPAARLNEEMDIPLVSADGLGRSRRVVRCDLFWPDYLLAIEYESDEEHLSSYRFSQDSIRRNDLISANVTVLTVTKRQLLNRAYWPDLAGRISTITKRRRLSPPSNYAVAQGDLYAQLLGDLCHW